ncbi:NAD-dependent protein deacetylase sirtuin-1 [Geranomyces variabilis]|uniref:NAD-dependent protein deacetylase sirtuin-1 n=1 Tax=Geranomyces variabilis TaxID=109894 RepID=A0AAD5TI93_9FUNG|nr:NAD-dependent protein deacetylase sirtuin-1 [Geranomyces variabilis]
MAAHPLEADLPSAKRLKVSSPPPQLHTTSSSGSCVAAGSERELELELGAGVESHLEVEFQRETDTEIVTADRQLVGETHYAHSGARVLADNGTAASAHKQEKKEDAAADRGTTASGSPPPPSFPQSPRAHAPPPPAAGGPDTPHITISEKSLLIMQDEARHLDFWEWMEKYRELPFSVLFKVFGAKMPEILHDEPDLLLPLLHSVMMKKIAKRNKRHDINTLEQVVELLQTCKNIVVLTGAGVSVSCGIPDFRSTNGIYSRLDEFELDDPQQMFDLEYFRIQPQTFYTFAREIYPSNFKPSPSHMFIKLLEEKGKLLRNYTQNIDTLEQLAGIKNVVQCHGSFATAKCIVCGYAVDGAELKEDIFNQTVPRCPRCPEENEGIMKPGITFFGEMLPDEFDRMFAADREKVDLLIVMGSSLKVSPVADVKDKVPHDVPQILINMEALPHMAGFDVQLLGYCDSICAQLCKLLGWELRHEKLEEQSQQQQQQQQPEPTPLPQTESPATGSEQQPDTATNDIAPPPAYRQGRLPHQYLFEGAIGSADMDPRAYIPSDREDDSGTSASSDDDDDDDEEEDSGAEEGTNGGREPEFEWEKPEHAAPPPPPSVGDGLSL